MERIRKPFQGVRNIIRFNWHFYLLATVTVTLMLWVATMLHHPLTVYVNLITCLVIATTTISLLVSLYIYDLSNLYSLNWLDGLNLNTGTGSKLFNINAGFDETSHLLQQKYPSASLQAFDFYDPAKHTEISIKRARSAYPAYGNTIAVTTSSLPLETQSADAIFLLFAAHEIRDDDERAVFFNELSRVLKSTGKVIVTEHLRNKPNFLAYNIGFLHFLSKASWYRTFRAAYFTIETETKITPFITTFTLIKNGTAS